MRDIIKIDSRSAIAHTIYMIGVCHMANTVIIKVQDLIDKFQYAINNNWGYIWGTAGVKWTAEKQAAATRDMTVKYGKKWIGHMVADCSGLFTWAFKQLGGYMYHGSNTMYKSYCTAKGKLTGGKRSDGQTLKAGSAVFTGTENDHGHVGLYIGNGTVIEAKGTQAGVIKSNVADKKWTYWGELKGVDYGDGSYIPEPDPAPAPDKKGEYPTIKRGSKGEFVTLCQTKLVNKGYDIGSCGVDGDFGKATEAAVKQFQRDWGLTEDGIVGAKTWELLNSDAKVTLYTVHIPHLPLYQAEALIKRYPGSTRDEERG